MKTSNTKEFIKKAKLIHGDKYSYECTTYKKSNIKVDIKCPIHGIFSQKPNNHLAQKSGCKNCNNDKHFISKMDVSKIDTEPGTKLIGLNHNRYVIVDENDYDKLIIFKWSGYKMDGKKYYAYTYMPQYGRKRIAMHRFIMNIFDPKIIVDHKDRNELNNRKSNLRLCSQAENSRNAKTRKNSTSKYLGVCRDTNSNRWVALISKDRVKYFLGRFEYEIDAARAYDEKARILHGEFANLNCNNYDLS